MKTLTKSLTLPTDNCNASHVDPEASPQQIQQFDIATAIHDRIRYMVMDSINVQEADTAIMLFRLTTSLIH